MTDPITLRKQLLDHLSGVAGYNDKGFHWAGHSPAEQHAEQQQAQLAIVRLVAEIGESAFSPILLDLLKSGAASTDGSGDIYLRAKAELAPSPSMADGSPPVAYKILTADQWTAFQAVGSFQGAPIDQTDGYIHLSAADQLQGTLDKHFAGQTGLVIVTVDLTVLGDAVRWEVSRGGALFPHLYRALPMAAVRDISVDGTPSARIEMAAPAADAPPQPPPSSALIPKKPLILKIGKWLQPRINAAIGNSSRVGDQPFHDTADFPWIAKLEANWTEIRAEAAAVLGDLERVPPLAAISPDHRRIAPAGKWRSYFFHGYGYRVDANCAACPKTAALLDEVPGLNSALFSILVPGTHIPAHTGVTKAILTCHLGIQVPQKAEDCRMRVADRFTTWREGKAFVFDDIYQHEVWNDTDETRIILLVQFRRPVGLVGKLLGEGFLKGVRHSRFVQDARRGLAQWTNLD